MSEITNEYFIDAVKNWIKSHEQLRNQFHDIGGVKIHNLKQITSNVYNVEYSVEVISKMDDFWRKWASGKLGFNTEDIKEYLRDSKIDQIIKNPD